MLIVAKLEELAATLDLKCETGKSPDGLDEVYLFSLDLRYRYAFARWWRDDGRFVLWIGINPAKGDTEKRRRPTLERCILRSRALGAGGLIFGNLFAARHNKPHALQTAPDPVGRHNDAVLHELSAIAEHTFVAWGAGGNLHGRAAQVVPLLRNPMCLGVTANGQPRHPLYVRNEVVAQPWPCKAE